MSEWTDARPGDLDAGGPSPRAGAPLDRSASEPVEIDVASPHQPARTTPPAPDASEPWQLDPHVRPEPGQRVGPYRLIEEVGAGGMGVVFEAEQDDPARRVAVKLIHLVGLDGAAFERFRSEAAALARLQHPGIATVHQSGVGRREDGATFGWIAMELIPGAMPVNAWARAAKLDRRARVGLFLDACDAVEHAHRHGIIHRDLKPANLLVGDDGRLRVIDFGVATLEARGAERSDRSGTHVADVEASGTERGSDGSSAGGITGTPGYAAPEQRQPNPPVPSVRVDVHALGTVLRVLMTGRRPGSAIRPREVPADLVAIIDRATAGRAEDRYASIDAMVNDVRRWLAHRPVAARPVSRGRRLMLSVRRRPVHWVAAGGLVLAGVFATQLARAAARESGRAAAWAELSDGAALLDALNDTFFEATAQPGERGNVPRPSSPGALGQRFDLVLARELDTEWERRIATGEAMGAMSNGQPRKAVEIMEHVRAFDGAADGPWDFERTVRIETLGRALYHYGEVEAAIEPLRVAMQHWDRIAAADDQAKAAGDAEYVHLARVRIALAEALVASGAPGEARALVEGIDAFAVPRRWDRSFVRARAAAVESACNRLDGIAPTQAELDRLRDHAQYVTERAPEKPAYTMAMHLAYARRLVDAGRTDEAIAALDDARGYTARGSLRHPSVAALNAYRFMIMGSPVPLEEGPFRLAVRALEHRVTSNHPMRVLYEAWVAEAPVRPAMQMIPATPIKQPTVDETPGPAPVGG